MNVVAPIASQPTNAAQTLFAQRRTAIDLITTTRAKTIRVELVANYLFRQHPKHCEDDAIRQSRCAELRTLLDELDHARQLMAGQDPSRRVHPDIAAWIGNNARQHPDQINAFDTIVSLTGAVVSAAEANNIDALQKAIEAHSDFGHSKFFQSVTSFIDILWSGLDDARDKEVARANATAAAIDKTLQRLEHIGKHVRLVSLNASVEAARVGDAGRGLGVIAVEFKSLAEEIQHLATTARADVTAMERLSG